MITIDQLTNLLDAYMFKTSGETLNIVDTEDVTAATTYYPSAAGTELTRYSALSLTGKLITTGTITMTVEVSNDEDLNGDWIQIYGYDNKADSNVNSLTVSNATLLFALLFNGLNYSRFRVKIVDSANTNTYIVKGRKVY
jgi:hypothetical protein